MTDAALTTTDNTNNSPLALNGDVADSPAIESPATPVDNSPTANVKIDVEHGENDVDMTVETVNLKVEDASTVPQVATPADPDSIPIDPPKGSPPPPPGELLPDVKMAEESQSNASADDTHMSDTTTTPAGAKRASPDPSTSSAHVATVDSVDATSPYSNVASTSNNDDVQPPPAKRARMHSDADEASIANTATPPPASVSPAPQLEAQIDSKPPRSGPSTLSVAQHRFCLSTIRSLKRTKDAGPFNHPVDPVALNIPHYPSIIKHPMDFSTIERKLNSSNPAKPDTNTTNPRYNHADEFISDVRLVFANCLTFNGPEHFITAMSKRLEASFDKMIKNMPPPEEVKPPVVKKQATPPPPPPPPAVPAQQKPKAARRPSTSVPVVRRNEESSGRPKREIHPPPPKDLPYADAPRKPRKAKSMDPSNAEQLKFCDKILKDLHRKTHYNIAHPFYEPVDWVKLDIPSYPKLIKKPMDLSTMRKKLEGGEYTTAQQFHDDFKLMIRNCFTFNPAGTPVNIAGAELQRLFDQRWKALPPIRPSNMSDDEDDEEEAEDSEDEKARAIAEIEAQIHNMHKTLAVMKNEKKKDKDKKKKDKPLVASSSKVTPKANGKSSNGSSASAIRKKMTKKANAEDDTLSFDQKKELSDSIGKLDGTKLERVIQIIHEGVPEIRDSTEEIELEIDQLPPSVLTKLYNFVIRPTRAPPVKRGGRTGKGTGTGGLKRKSMDEDVEAEKIRVLEERMRLFEKNAGGGDAPVGPTSVSAVASGVSGQIGAGSDHSSDSSSDDSSGSDSE